MKVLCFPEAQGGRSLLAHAMSLLRPVFRALCNSTSRVLFLPVVKKACLHHPVRAGLSILHSGMRKGYGTALACRGELHSAIE
jgi:hypothetical protein